MTVKNKILSFIAVVLLSVTSLSIIPISSVLASPLTCAWTGATNDNFNTATNWSSCNSAAPVAGSNLVFDVTSLTSDTTLTNDMTGASFANITFQGTNSSDYGFTITGNVFSLSAGITNTSGSSEEIDTDITLTADQSFDDNLTIGTSTNTLALSTNNLVLGGDIINSKITGSGNITQASAYDYLNLNGDDSGYSGNISIIGQLTTEGNTPFGSGTVSVTGAGTQLSIYTCSDNQTVTGNLNISGASSDPNDPDFTTGPPLNYFQGQAKITTGETDCNPLTQQGGGGGGGSGPTYDEYYEGGYTPTDGSSVTLAGSLTLGSNVTLSSEVSKTTVTSSISGSYALTNLAGGGGSLVINSTSNSSTTADGTYTSSPFTINLSNTSTNTVYAGGDYIVTITGQRGSTEIDAGATLNGTGTVGSLLVDSGGTVVPGSTGVGCLNTGNLTENGTLSVVLDGTTACTGYDQLKVTGTVNLTGGVLGLTIASGFTPKAGDTYELISNDGSDAVTGTLTYNNTNLTEGSTFTLDGTVFKISYKGGDGNDVVLTVVSAKTPDTGMALVAAHPGATIIFASLSAIGLLAISRRYHKVSHRK